MANTRFQYVKKYELDDSVLPDCWLVVRIDGKAFHRFCDVHCFVKPNDIRSVSLLNSAAEGVMHDYKDVVLAYGQSDEYSFLLPRTTRLYNRRASKIVSNLVSAFTAHVVFNWPKFFAGPAMSMDPAPDMIAGSPRLPFQEPSAHDSATANTMMAVNGGTGLSEGVCGHASGAASGTTSSALASTHAASESTPLVYPPTFDGRLICYPNGKCVRDYFSWRQADCHINNLYNTCFWMLVCRGGRTPKEAEQDLSKTVSGDKNEILFSRFHINYNDLPAIYRKGTVLLRVPASAANGDRAKGSAPMDTKGPHPAPESSRSPVKGNVDAASSQPSEPDGPTSKKRSRAGKGPKQPGQVVTLHCDVIGPSFWDQYPFLLA